MKFGKNLRKKSWYPYTVAGCITVILFVLLWNIGTIKEAFITIIGYFSTILIGCVMAYIMNPISRFFERTIFKKIKSESLKWTLSVMLTVVITTLALILIIVMLIPQLIKSLGVFVGNLDQYAASVQAWLHRIIPSDSEELQSISLSTENIMNKVMSYIMEHYNKIIHYSAAAGKTAVDLIIGAILSVYLLSAKKRLKSGIVRLLKAVIPKNNYPAVSDFLTRCNNILNRYIVFSLIDALIIGTVNALFMMVCGMQYTGLVSVIVGVTNLIPTFGPIIGAVIGAFILLMTKPLHALLFIIFVLLLQTADGYIIKPKLFGNTLGISGLLILIMIVVGGKIAGITGILLAIPAAAILDHIYREFVLTALEKRRKQSDESETTGNDITSDP